MKDFYDVLEDAMKGDEGDIGALVDRLQTGQLSEEEFNHVLRQCDTALEGYDSVQGQNHEKLHRNSLFIKTKFLERGYPAANVSPDFKKAADYCRAAVTRYGSSWAMTLLGRWIEEGIVSPTQQERDVAKSAGYLKYCSNNISYAVARDYYHRAVERGNSIAMCRLGIMMKHDEVHATAEECDRVVREVRLVDDSGHSRLEVALSYYGPDATYKRESAAHYYRLAIRSHYGAILPYIGLAYLLFDGKVVPTQEEIDAAGGDDPYKVQAYLLRECIRISLSSSAVGSACDLLADSLRNEEVEPTLEEFENAGSNDRNEVAAYFYRLAILQYGVHDKAANALTKLGSLISKSLVQPAQNIEFILDLLLRNHDNPALMKCAKDNIGKIQNYLLAPPSEHEINRAYLRTLQLAVEEDENGKPANLLSKALHHSGGVARLFRTDHIKAIKKRIHEVECSFVRVIDHVQEGDFRQARDLLKSYLKLHPGDILYYFEGLMRGRISHTANEEQFSNFIQLFAHEAVNCDDPINAYQMLQIIRLFMGGPPENFGGLRAKLIFIGDLLMSDIKRAQMEHEPQEKLDISELDELRIQVVHQLMEFENPSITNAPDLATLKAQDPESYNSVMGEITEHRRHVEELCKPREGIAPADR